MSMAVPNYEMSSNPRCVLCTDPLRKHYEMALSEGTVSSEAISEALGTTKAQVQRHMKHHLKPIVQESAASMIAKKEVNEVEILSNNVQRLDSKLDEIFAQDELDPKVIDSLTKLAREVRESLKYLMQFIQMIYYLKIHQTKYLKLENILALLE